MTRHRAFAGRAREFLSCDDPQNVAYRVGGNCAVVDMRRCGIEAEIEVVTHGTTGAPRIASRERADEPVDDARAVSFRCHGMTKFP